MQTDGRLTYTIKEAAYDLARRGELPGIIKLGNKRLVVSKFKLDNLLKGEARSAEVSLQ